MKERIVIPQQLCFRQEHEWPYNYYSIFVFLFQKNRIELDTKSKITPS